jgi:alkylhydroperoxidase family enzyme
MNPRMPNPALILGVNPSIQAMMGPIYQSGIDKTVLDLVGLRVGQMNECQLCIGQSFSAAEGDPMLARLQSVSTWREADCFSPSEQAALALAEAITALRSRYDSVPDGLWADVEAHFDETQRAALVLFIAMMNMFTRINVATRQMTADWQ